MIANKMRQVQPRLLAYKHFLMLNVWQNMAASQKRAQSLPSLKDHYFHKPHAEQKNRPLILRPLTALPIQDMQIYFASHCNSILPMTENLKPVCLAKIQVQIKTKL
jgi:hypothetical protein